MRFNTSVDILGFGRTRHDRGVKVFRLRLWRKKITLIRFSGFESKFAKYTRRKSSVPSRWRLQRKSIDSGLKRKAESIAESGPSNPVL
jgi:hypothetical protein